MLRVFGDRADVEGLRPGREAPDRQVVANTLAQRVDGWWRHGEARVSGTAWTTRAHPGTEGAAVRAVRYAFRTGLSRSDFALLAISDTR